MEPSETEQVEVIPILVESSKKSPTLTRENSQNFSQLPYDPDHSLEEMQDDLQSLSALLKEAEEEIKQLRYVIKEKDKKISSLEADNSQTREQHVLMKQRYVNEINNLKEQVELANASKIALEENNIEREKEIQKLRNRLAELPIISNKAPLWVPDWFTEECTACKVGFNVIRRKVKSGS